MPILDLFSKRMRRKRANVPDVYVYDALPPALRVQAIHIWRTPLGVARYEYVSGWNASGPIWSELRQALCRERGVFYLHDRSEDNPQFDLENYFLSEKSAELALDVIELVFCRIYDAARLYAADPYRGSGDAYEEAISEMNARFREHAVGYTLDGGQLLRIDDQHIHQEVVKPTLNLLSEKLYKGPEQEFRRAHEHYRYGRNEEALVDCLKAFESTMKVICEQRGWTYNKSKDGAQRLIGHCIENGLFPEYLQGEMTALRTLLESGIPTIRNKAAGHGQGSVQRAVPAHMVSYALHLTASTILFLADANRRTHSGA